MGCFSMPKGVPNKRHTGEFKQMVVETMMRDKLSYREVARQFEISGHEQIRKWERIYLIEGSEGLYIERRGRGSKGRPTKFPKEVEEDLLKEVQRLRAENAYLKKLQGYQAEYEPKGQLLRQLCYGELLWSSQERTALLARI